MKRAIVNVSVGSWYPRGQQRLKDSLESHGETADLLRWTNSHPAHSPTHQQQPYAFKPYAFAYALMNGYDHVLWLDSSVMLCRPLDQVWKWIAKDGYCFGNDGWFVGQWCNQNALEEMGLTREEAWKIPLMDGKIIGLDLTSEIGRTFLTQWLDGADRGLFKGEWYGDDQHRHDITIGSIVASRLGMKLHSEFLTRSDCEDAEQFVRAYGL